MEAKKHGGRRPGSGRKRGTRNKATVELKGMAQEFTQEAIEVLAEVMRDPESPAVARISAANSLLDRGYGKPAVHIEEVSGKVDQELLDKIQNEYQVKIDAARERQRLVLIERGIIVEA